MRPCTPVIPAAALLNGDDALTPAERRAYLHYHAQRNRENARLSRSEDVRTLPAPTVSWEWPDQASPGRAAMMRFIEHALETLAPALIGRDITVLDLGCGRGVCLAPLIAAGLTGRYIGLDIRRDRKWIGRSAGGGAFDVSLLLADACTIDPRTLPNLDLIISATALEHLHDDAGALQRLASRLRPGGAQIHAVPGEAGLELYQTHGWRQYSPRCLHALFPGAEIYRLGGPVSSMLHVRGILGPLARARPTLPQRRPVLYKMLRTLALEVDARLGSPAPHMYGVICRPQAPGAARDDAPPARADVRGHEPLESAA